MSSYFHYIIINVLVLCSYFLLKKYRDYVATAYIYIYVYFIYNIYS